MAVNARIPAGTMRMPATWWAKAAVAGLCGGLALFLFQALVAIVGHGNGWDFVNRVGAIYPAFRTLPAGFAVGPTLAGIFTHLGIAVCIGLVYGVIVDALPAVLSSAGMAIVSGAIGGFWTWVVVGRTIGPVVSPGFWGYPQMEFLVAHACFGAVTAVVLFALARQGELAQLHVTMFPSERLRVGAVVGPETTTTT